jgi:hypothetical protein
MKTFKDYILAEALRIVKKNTPAKPLNKPRETKDNFKPAIDVSYFDNVEIVRSKHSKEIRDGQLVSRDDGLRDAVILKAIKKAWKKGLRANTKTVITYKNKKKKYDMIVIDWKQSQDKIILITSIQDNKNSPKTYFRQSNKTQDKIMTEQFNEYEVIELEEI